MNQETKIYYFLIFIIILFFVSCWRLKIARKAIFEQCPSAPIQAYQLLYLIAMIPAVHLFNNFWKNVFEKIAPRYIKENTTEKLTLPYAERIKKFSYNGYKMMYHIIISAVELIIMKDIGWLNFNFYSLKIRNISYLFGMFDTSFYNIFYEDYPCAPFPISWKMLYLLQMSCYLEKLIFGYSELQGRRDKFEMVSHHLISFILIFISIFNQHHKIGFFILIWRDISDIFSSKYLLLLYFLSIVYLSKFFLTFWTKMTVITIIIALIIWGYSRNYQHLIYLCSDSVLFVYYNHNKIELFCSYIEVIFIYLLAILDFVWFFLIILSIVKFNKEGQAGNKCEEVDEEPEASLIAEEKPLKKSFN